MSLSIPTRIACGLACALLATAGARADCPEGNLLAGKRPVEWLDAYHVDRITDGLVSPRGAAWDNDTNARLTRWGRVTYDLGAETTVSAVYLQGEGRTTYTLSVSTDGEGWTPVSNVPATAEAGMQERFARATLDRSARYLRISSGSADGLYAIGEAAVWCRAPDEWPPRFPEREGRIRNAGWSAARKKAIAYGKLVFVVAGCALILAARRYPAARRWCYAAVIAGGAAAWTNFGSFHGPQFTHYHEAFHYYLGSEYFDELGYTRLYACAVEAESELGLAEVARNRYVTDLATNLMTTGDALLSARPACRDAFGPARWEAFREDVRWFRNHLYPGSWQRVFRDHGYNATPLWTLLGKALGALGSSASTAVPRAVGFDVLAWVAIGLMIGRVFGLQALALTALALGGGLPWFFDFTGGAVSRFAWLACLVAGLCLLNRERPFAAGVALGLAAALRVFPAVFLGALGLAAVAALLRRRPLGSFVRLFGGVAATLALTVVLTSAVLGTSSWSAFFANTRKHATTPVGNLMGLPTIVTWDPAASQGRILTTEIESLERWRVARAAALAERRALYGSLAALVVGLCAWTAWRRDYPLWEWVLLAFPLAVGLGQISSYYYVFLILLAPWVVDRPGRLALLAAALAASLAIGLAGWATDVQYVALSVVFVALPLAMWAARVRETEAIR